MSILRDYQEQAITDVDRRFAAGDTRVPIVLATGLGKGHPLNERVPTPDGWRMWGDLTVGDRIFDRHGDPTVVTAIFDRGELPAYRVMFSDESSVDVDGDHLWAVRDSGQSHHPWIAASTAELARHELKRIRGWRFHIPMAGATRYDAAAALPLHPYVVGALISNGSMTSKYHTVLSTPDEAVAERVRAAGQQCIKINDADPAICDRYRLPYATVLTEQLRMRVHSKHKTVPDGYLTASVPDRIALLQGLMDGDGAKRDDTRRSVAYFTSSEMLAEDVRELVNSLGGTGIVKRYDRGDKGIEFAVRVLLPSGIEPFSTARKSGNGSAGVRNLQPKRAIVSIKPIGQREIRCITVAAPDHLYLIGQGYHVTHNTQIFTSYADRWLNKPENAGKRVLIIAHTDELISQAARRQREISPKRRVGIVKAAQNEVLAEIVVSSRQTLASSRRREQIKRVGLIIIDECHHAVRTNTYGKILDHFNAFGTVDDAPGVPAFTPSVLGVTATLARSDKAKLSSVWQDVSFTRDILFGIRRGYLLDVRGERVIVPDLDFSNVRVRAGDYADGDIADELERTFAPEVIAREYLRLAGFATPEECSGPWAGVRRGIAFWPLVDTAYHGAKAFDEVGIRSGVVHGALPKPERREVLQRFHLPLSHPEAIDVMHNAMVLTEGFDEPTADVVVIARPTRSAALYQQMVGRVLRPNLELPAEQREKALILDVTGAGEHHDLRSLIDLSPDRTRGQDEEMGDRSLLEWDEFLEELEEESRGQGGGFSFEEEVYAGATQTKTFDPLGRDKVWGTTPNGHYFISAGADGYVFLAPSLADDAEPNTYDVVTCSKGVGGTAKGTGHTGLGLELALGWGEEVAMGIGGVGAKTLSGRKSAWRRAEPTEAQKKLAKSRGVWREGMNKGECSEAIDASFAAARIDPLVDIAVAMVRARAARE